MKYIICIFVFWCLLPIGVSAEEPVKIYFVRNYLEYLQIVKNPFASERDVYSHSWNQYSVNKQDDTLTDVVSFYDNEYAEYTVKSNLAREYQYPMGKDVLNLINSKETIEAFALDFGVECDIIDSFGIRSISLDGANLPAFTVCLLDSRGEAYYMVVNYGLEGEKYVFYKQDEFLKKYSLSETGLIINGAGCSMSAFKINDGALLPLRGVFETVGYNVLWEEESKTIILSDESGNRYRIEEYGDLTDLNRDISYLVWSSITSNVININDRIYVSYVMMQDYLDFMKVKSVVDIEPFGDVCIKTLG